MQIFDSKIRYSETDSDEYLTVESLINYFQDASTLQSREAGVGTQYLRDHGICWMVLSWQLEIKRLPKFYERVRVCTFPYAMKGFSGLRNFYMDAETENLKFERIVSANSNWVLMNIASMMPERISKEHIDRYIFEEKLDMEYMDRKIRLSSKASPVEAEKTVIQESHLDSNNHVNNGKYIRFAMDALAKKLPHGAVSKKIRALKSNNMRGSEGLRIRTEYRKQAHIGDVLVPYIYEDIGIVDIRMDDETCCLVELS